jgi:hypothetical protein
MSSIAKTADHLAEQAKTATLVARASVIDLGSQALRLINKAHPAFKWVDG